jgi:ATP-binding protein involved in chromosome partitioning
MAQGNTNRNDSYQKQDIEIKERLRHIKNKILVMSGKGGVGKSSIAAYLSVALTKRGYKVGLMDVDLHGPSIPRMLGLKGNIGPGASEGKAHPVRYLPSMEVISIEPLMGENKDPGTGDEPLTVAQTIPDAKAIIVTTPQEISLADVRKSINFCRQVNMEILGIVENMSGLKCPYCGEMIDVFKTRGGMLTAKREGLRILGILPLEPEVVSNGDKGSMSLLDNDKSAITQEFNKIVDMVVKVTESGGDIVMQAQEKEVAN